MKLKLICLLIDDRISGNKHDNQVNNFKMHCIHIYNSADSFCISNFFFFFHLFACFLFFYRSKQYLIKWRPQSLHYFIFALTAFIFTVYHITQLIHLFVAFLYVLECSVFNIYFFLFISCCCCLFLLL